MVATPVSFIFINKLTNLQGDMLAHTDRRIALVNQLLAGMKSLKMYAWEAAQEARVRPGSDPLSSAARWSQCVNYAWLHLHLHSI